MSTPVRVAHTGVLVGSSSSCSFVPGGVFDTTFGATYATNKSGQDDIVNATLLAPFVLPLENVVKVRVLAVRASGNTVKMLLTSSAGADQEVLLGGGGLHLFHQPNVGDEITSIKFVGNGTTVSYFIAGDAS